MLFITEQDEKIKKYAKLSLGLGIPLAIAGNIGSRVLLNKDVMDDSNGIPRAISTLGGYYIGDRIAKKIAYKDNKINKQK